MQSLTPLLHNSILQSLFPILHNSIPHDSILRTPFSSMQSAGFSALYLASQEDNSCLCQVLLEAGADSNLTGSSQALSPLHIAAHKYIIQLP